MSALTRKLGSALVAILLLGGGWHAHVHGQSLTDALVYLEAPRFQNEIFLPYVADKARQDQILLHMNALEAGLKPAEVTALLGAPDEITAMFVAGERTDEIQGFQYVYLLERSRADEWGKAYDERYIHVNFNMAGLLVSAEGFAVPQFKEVIREMGLGFAFSMGLHETVQINDLTIRLDFIHDADVQRGAESAQDGASDAGEAILAVSMPDRADNLKLTMGSAKQGEQATNTYSRYRITLLGIPATDRVSIIVE